MATTAYPTGSKIDTGPRWETVADAGALQANAPVPYRMGTLRLWIVKLDSGEVLALSARDPHPHGCNVAWRPDLETAGHTGWFRELCLGSTYSLNGVKALGPSPRGMDRYETRVYCDDAQIYLGPKTLIEGSGDLAPYFSGR